MFRRIELIAYVVKDAVVNTTHSGNRIPVNFTVVTNEKHGDTEKSFFYPCVIWSEKESAIKYCERIRKGGLLWLEGLPEVNLWENKSGKPVAEIKIDVKNFRNLSKKEQSANSNNTNIEHTNG